MSINAGMMTSTTPEWATPQKLFDDLNAEFGPFDLDPCATPANAKCSWFFTQEENGLLRPWRSSKVFMNPPYGRQIGLWMEKALRESQSGATVVCLVPARTCSAWWHDYAMKGHIRFIRGRVKFGGHKWNAPFPSAIVIFRPTPRSGREE